MGGYMKSGKIIKIALFTLLAMAALSLTAFSGDLEKFEFGVRGNIVTVDGGEPTNDMSGGGIMGRYRIADHWLVGVSLDHYAEFDVEEPATIVGVYQDKSVEPIDATGDAVTISSWIERRFAENPEGGLSWFVTGGLGISFIEVDTAKGATVGGGRFEIETNPGTDFIFSATAGPRYTLLKRWTVELGARLDHHIAEWEYMDKVSGRKGTVDDHTAFGGYLGINYRF